MNEGEANLPSVLLKLQTGSVQESSTIGEVIIRDSSDTLGDFLEVTLRNLEVGFVFLVYSHTSGIPRLC